jgi:hypothetical protein
VCEELGNDADNAGGDDLATIWRRCPRKGLSHGKTAASQKRWMGERGHLTVKFHVIGDSSRFQPIPATANEYLAKARGTSAGN